LNILELHDASVILGDARVLDSLTLSIGAGEHTEWLLQETALGDLQSLYFFDSDPARAGAVISGRTILPARDIPAAQLNAIVPSSLAFHEEMVSFLEALPVSGMRIVRCYP